MNFHIVILCFIFNVLRDINSQSTLEVLRLGWKWYYPCEQTTKIFYHSEAVESKDMDFSFFMEIEENLKRDSIINITFAVPAAFNKSDFQHASYFSRQDKINVYLLSPQKKLSLRLKTYNGHIPVIESVLINNVEYCKDIIPVTEKVIPLSELNNKFNFETSPLPKPAVLLRREDLQECGVRKIDHAELIVNGVNTKSGDWPWHVAIESVSEMSAAYFCGGTLISKDIVLTVATCVTEEGRLLPTNTLRVILGQYSINGAGDPIQVINIAEIIVHPNFNPIFFENDIAILKLDTPANFTNYVQAVCLWKPELLTHFSSYSEIQGTVVGWGLTVTKNVSYKLQKAEIPRVSNIQCVKSEPVYFSKALNGKNFCAGWPNGTAPCNGDSGGGFHVNVPDSVSPGAPKRWHVQGIISQSVAINGLCNPNKYVIFTEVGKFTDWINTYL